jgi:hypothetical protein
MTRTPSEQRFKPNLGSLPRHYISVVIITVFSTVALSDPSPLGYAKIVGLKPWFCIVMHKNNLEI